MRKPLISILLPVFNARPYLEACLESIRRQTFADWELIAVDDFSTDGSRTVLETAGRQDSRISVRSNSAKGIIPALRTALHHSRGALITRMDADDLMSPHKLEKLAGLLRQAGPGTVVTGLVRYFADDALQDGYRRYADWLNRIAREESWRRELYRECVVPSPCWMIHRIDLERCGAFSSGIYPEDYELVFRFFQAGFRIKAVHEVLHYWRDHPQRSSRNLAEYADQAYFDLKVPYFLKIDHAPSRELVVWGAGKKGKRVVRLLQASGYQPRWVCDTPQKWGKAIYGITLEDYRVIEQISAPQVLVLVSNPQEQEKIRFFLNPLEQSAGLTYFFFV